MLSSSYKYISYTPTPSVGRPTIPSQSSQPLITSKYMHFYEYPPVVPATKYERYYEDPWTNLTLTDPDFYELAKLVVNTVGLVPWRMVGSVATMAVTWFVAKMATLADGRWPNMRQVALSTFRQLTRSFLMINGFYHIECNGKVSDDARVIVSNHTSLWDPMVLAVCIGRDFSPVSRIENRGVPVLGAVLEMLNSILVDRKSDESKRESTQLIRARAHDHSTPPVMIFPEGTTTNGTAVISFKLGAFLPGEPVQPTIIRYPYQHFNNGWPPRVSLVNMILRTMCQFVNYVEVHFLPVYYPNEEEKRNPQLFAQNVRSLIAKALNVPMVEFQGSDGFSG